jgi:hypothetical protein
MYIPHPSLFFGEPPTEMKCTQMQFMPVFSIVKLSETPRCRGVFLF